MTWKGDGADSPHSEIQQMGTKRQDLARKRHFPFLSLEECSGAGIPWRACAETSRVATERLLLSTWLGLLVAHGKRQWAW